MALTVYINGLGELLHNWKNKVKDHCLSPTTATLSCATRTAWKKHTPRTDIQHAKKTTVSSTLTVACARAYK